MKRYIFADVIHTNINSDKMTDTIQTIFQHCQLDTEEIGSLLFPTHKHPKLAMKRILKGDGSLNNEQLAKLAMFVGLDLPDIFTAGWQDKVQPKGIVLDAGADCFAFFDDVTFTTRVFSRKSLWCCKFKVEAETTVDAFFEKLDTVTFQ